ncbi:glycosyltransferase family 39 protein [Ktedonobacteria bacterium brp13]|nr:glycosyltransferase family 39 protein [Ktedonobacteria bacterium brp13]
MAETSTTHPQTGPEHPTAPQKSQHFPVFGRRLALGGVLLVAILMDFYRLGQDGFGLYYPPAVLSMMDNWRNFFFAAYDPGGFTSLDKPPVGFWFQVLSARIFGLNTVSVLLPQAAFGVLSVLLLYYLVRRHFGVVAGLLAALALAISPVSVVTNRNATIDSTLTLCLLLGAWAVMRAAETGRLRWSLFSALFVSIGFNIKMLEAYLVVPAFGLLYLLAAPTSIKKRVLHLALALLVLLVVSFSWVLVVDLIPASQRQVRDVNVAPILAGLRVRALGGRGIDREPHHLLGGQLGEDTAHAQRLQLVKIDLPVGQGRIDTGPLSLEKGRLRQFGQASRLWAAQQAVAQAKQGVSSLFQAVIGVLTKRLPCIKVHLELAPGVFVVPGSLLQQAIFCNRELPVFTFV